MPEQSSPLRGPPAANGAASVLTGSAVPGQGVSTNRPVDRNGHRLYVNSEIRLPSGNEARIVGFAGDQLLFKSSNTPLRLGSCACRSVESLDWLTVDGV